MTYKDLFEKALKAKSMKVMTPKFHTFSEEGQEIVGRYVSINTVEKAEGEKNYSQYIFETDNGLIKFHLGSVADGEFGRAFQENHVYYIRFDGQEAISGSKKVNKFFCAEIGSA